MNKKTLLSIFILTIFSVVLGMGQADAQSKVIKKTVKKVVTPQIAPVEPPEDPASDTAPELAPPPPEPPANVELQEKPVGLFGWGLNADVAGNILTGSGWLAGARGDIVFADPLHLGEKIGLAEDAVEYKTGLGVALGATSGNQSFTALPLYADAVVYLKEKSFFGLDPFVGAGLFYNLAGSSVVNGTIGQQIYFGILAGQTEISLGYSAYNAASGITLGVTQPVVL